MNQESIKKVKRPTFSLEYEEKNLRNLGITPIRWLGDETPFRTGGIPEGYIGRTYFREWRKRDHNPDYLSYGPYFEPTGLGSLVELIFFLDSRNWQGSDDAVFTVDLVDHASGGTNLVDPVTFYVRDLSPKFACNIYLHGDLELKPGMSIESRVVIHGGADVRFYGLHYGVNYL
ncbi:hypothetical protein [Peribacillus phoenicis]|uniref:hypothetical protein n=1 Tax=unclassified Peribacillus TaxID=2675266 RepID=UPI0039A09A14